jgi:hypothetical protein
MYKTLLKLLIYEMVEKIVRFEQLVEELGKSEDHSFSPHLVSNLQIQVDALKRKVLSEKALLTTLFSEKSPKEKDFWSCIESVIYEPYQTLCQLSELLHLCFSRQVLPEAYLYLQDTLSDKFSVDRAQQLLLLVPETNHWKSLNSHQYQLEGLHLEPLSLLHKYNPLGWVSGTKGVVNSLYENSTALESLRIHLKGDLSKDSILRPLSSHLIALRLHGPAYYFYAVIEALLNRDLVFLNFFEEALFYGLNHLNLTDKSILILHEATEKSRQYFTEHVTEHQKPPSSTPLNLSLEEDRVGEILRTVEKLISDKYAFTQKHLNRSVNSQDRLGQEIILSSTPVYHFQEVHTSLKNQLMMPLSGNEKFPIYDFLTQVTETPNTPREIVNAGWLHKMDRSPVWLYNTLNSQGLEGFERLSELVARQDHLLIKSIETSEVHRVLLCGT